MTFAAHFHDYHDEATIITEDELFSYFTPIFVKFKRESFTSSLIPTYVPAKLCTDVYATGSEWSLEDPDFYNEVVNEGSHWFCPDTDSITFLNEPYTMGNGENFNFVMQWCDKADAAGIPTMSENFACKDSSDAALNA